MLFFLSILELHRENRSAGWCKPESCTACNEKLPHNVIGEDDTK